jgi:allantoinase
MTMYDVVVKNVRLVRPFKTDVPVTDLGIKDGKFACIGDLEGATAGTVVDGRGLMCFPGCIDPHQHVGIYQPYQEDALNESKCSAMGGVTTGITYMRTGQYYLNRGGPYKEVMPDLLEMSKERFYCDYAFHIAPIRREHRKEVELLAKDFGVTSFKIFMFYGSHGLHSASANQRDFLMIEDDHKYDFAHFEFIMRELTKLREKNPDIADDISLSLHCELAEILTAYTKIVQDEGKLTGLHAYSASRPQHSEGLAIFIAAYLANETAFPNINLLHLTSEKAMRAALQMEACFPHINFKREVTVAHLLLDVDSEVGCNAKVNPPIRPREDVEFLWKAMLDGKIDWVCSDHACCSAEQKVDRSDPTDIFKAKSGFGGTEWMLSGLFSEGTKRGMTPNRVAELTSANPASRFGLHTKGDIDVGKDADFVLFDPNFEFTVRGTDSPSKQGYTPFEGQKLKGKVIETFLRGSCIFKDNQVVGKPVGQYLHRPLKVSRKRKADAMCEAGASACTY